MIEKWYLTAQLTDAQATIKHLRGKAEFDMPDDMRGRFHNGQCPDPCDMIDGPCVCGAWHNVKEWLGKLNKQLAVEQEKVKGLRDEIRARRQWQTCPSCSRIFATDSGK